MKYADGATLEFAQNEIKIASKVRVANKWLSRFKGLLGTKKLDTGSGLWLIPCNSVHMIGMMYAIDVIYLDKDNNICKIVKRLKPFTISFGGKEAFSTIELVAGSLTNKDLKLGLPVKINQVKG